MGYARHIGRVGALAVTLGVGAAIANAPGIAYADTTGAEAGGETQTKTTSTDPASPAAGPASVEGDDNESSTTDRRSQRRSVVRAVVGAIRDIADGDLASGNAAGATSRLDKHNPAGSDATERTTTTTSTTVPRTRVGANDLADVSEKVESTVNTFTQRVEQAVQKYTAPAPSTRAPRQPRPRRRRSPRRSPQCNSRRHGRGQASSRSSPTRSAPYCSRW